jgi:hypothetical protein
MNRILQHYWPELIVTLVVWVLIGWQLGLTALIITIILSALEITLSADNAVVNSRVLVRMSRKWQILFLTVGIFIAVFLIRFALPIVMVASMTSLSSVDVLQLAISDAATYGEYLEAIAPSINAFGGIFLFFVAMFFFMEEEREHFWIRPVEKVLQRIGRIPYMKYILAFSTFVPVFYLTDTDDRDMVFGALVAGALVYLILHSIVLVMGQVNKKNQQREQIGWAAFVSFMYLEVLDASFSLDSVVGAFALTNNIVIIMAGLGIGAIWVRTMTLYMVKHKTLSTYRFLESGAHWAIACLALIMFLKLAHIELPELIVGAVGMTFIGASVYTSVLDNRRSLRTTEGSPH